MAGILALIGGAIINATAFSGSQFVFSKLSGHGESERKRHDLAMENYQRARNEWLKRRELSQDLHQKHLEHEQDAQDTEDDMEAAGARYYKYWKSDRKPLISDFYHPSEEQQNAELAYIVLGLGGLGYALYKYV